MLGMFNIHIQQNGGEPMRCKIVVFFVLLFPILLSSCSEGRGDWKYLLPNGYDVFMVNSETIVVRGPYHSITEDGIEALTQTYVDNFVSAFCFNERYVGVQQLPNYENLSAYTAVSPHFYLLDTFSGTVFGPFESEDVFNAKCKDLQTGDFCDWITTDKNPNK